MLTLTNIPGCELQRSPTQLSLLKKVSEFSLRRLAWKFRAPAVFSITIEASYEALFRSPILLFLLSRFPLPPSAASGDFFACGFALR
jgi:hypothetical protein